MKNVWGVLLLCTALLSTVSPALALNPDRQISQYAHTAWRIQDGYFTSEPNALAQTRDGYLWIGTNDGLFTFDGVRFVLWKPPAGEELPSRLISALAADPQGGLWIGTAHGLSHWDGHDLNHVDTHERILSILITPTNTVWVTIWEQTDSLCIVRASLLECRGKDSGIRAALPLAKVTQGGLWLSSDDSLVSLKPGGLTNYRVPGLSALKDKLPIRAIAVAPDHSVWVGVMRSGKGPGQALQHLVGSAWEKTEPTFNVTPAGVTALVFDRSGDLWIGTLDQGLYRLSHQSLDHFDTTNGLSGDSVQDLLQDAEGNIWAATSSGIDSFRDLPVVTYSKQQGLSADRVGSIISRPDGAVWVGLGGSLDLIKNLRVESIRARHGLPGFQVNSLLVDHAGRLWVGIDDSLYIYSNHRFRSVATLDHKPIGYIRAMIEDPDHNVWALTTSEHKRHILEIVHDRVSKELVDPRLIRVTRLAADPSGGVWLSAEKNGLFLYRDSQLALYSADRHRVVSSFVVNTDRSLWAPTAQGLVFTREHSYSTLSIKNGLPCEDIYSVLEDLHHSLWLYASCGLIEIPEGEIQRWTANPQVSVAVTLFGNLDGVHPSENEWNPGATRSLNGRLWFANNSIVQMIDPDGLESNPIAPPVHVEAVIADGKDYASSRSISLGPKTRDLEIDYTALSFVAPKKVYFQVMLKGYDLQWIDVGTRRSAFYTNLSPGRYTFLVRACNNSGLWNRQGATFSFMIVPAWYQTRTFRVLCLCLLLASFYAAYLFRLSQQQAAMERSFKERLQERTRIAHDLHDTLLQTIVGSELMAASIVRGNETNTLKIQGRLDQLCILLGRASREGRAAVESLHSIDVLDLTTALGRLVHEYQMNYSVDISLSVQGKDELTPSAIKSELFWIASEAIRNACQHSGASRVFVQLTNGPICELRISDSGKGIRQDVLENGKSGHFGLAGMRERAAMIDASLTILSSEAGGTTIHLIATRGHSVWRRLLHNFPLLNRVVPLTPVKRFRD